MVAMATAAMAFSLLYLLLLHPLLIRACYRFPADRPDPCLQKDCRFGALCRPARDGRSAECVCPSTCASFGDARGSRPVCASDGRDYQNTCELRRAACRARRELSVRFWGACDPCKGVECPEDSTCQLDAQRNPICRCGARCDHTWKAVCASDGRSYHNECLLRREACRARRPLRILHSGACHESNPCATLQCARGQHCDIDRYGIATCQCPPPCPPVVRPVCAQDGRTFDSACELRRRACIDHEELREEHAGPCGEWR